MAKRAKGGGVFPKGNEWYFWGVGFCGLGRDARLRKSVFRTHGKCVENRRPTRVGNIVVATIVVGRVFFSNISLLFCWPAISVATFTSARQITGQLLQLK